MAVKKKAQKRAKLDALYASCVKIKCCFCDIKDDCKTRQGKEKSESLGFTTYCSLTPNRTKSFVKKHKKKV